MYVCLCNGVTDSQIKSAIKNGCDSYAKIRQTLSVANQCGRCACEIKKMVNLNEQTLQNMGNSQFKDFNLAYQCV